LKAFQNLWQANAIDLWLQFASNRDRVRVS